MLVITKTISVQLLTTDWKSGHRHQPTIKSTKRVYESNISLVIILERQQKSIVNDVTAYDFCAVLVGYSKSSKKKNWMYTSKSFYLIKTLAVLFIIITKRSISVSETENVTNNRLKSGDFIKPTLRFCETNWNWYL